MTWKHSLPNFETLGWANTEKLRTANSFRYLGLDDSAIRGCNPRSRCRRGLCAACIRRLRFDLLNFLEAGSFDRKIWHFVTIRVEGWKMAPGDVRGFRGLRDHRLIENLITRFRRMGIPGLLIFGSIETVYVTIANVPVGKPFHLHLMISGADAVQIRSAVEATIPLDSGDPRPLDIRQVVSTARDFFKAASYAFKQPLMKKSKASPDHSGRRQSLNASERRELIQNYGVHGWTGRLILVGIRCDRGRFRLIANLSATGIDGAAAQARQLPARHRRQPP